MNSNVVEKVQDGVAVALPQGLWRITAELQMAIARRLAAAGHRIVISRFSGDYRDWQILLSSGLWVEVSVDCHINPGVLKIAVRGEGLGGASIAAEQLSKNPCS
jgi:hypothetical protein